MTRSPHELHELINWSKEQIANAIEDPAWPRPDAPNLDGIVDRDTHLKVEFTQMLPASMRDYARGFFSELGYNHIPLRLDTDREELPIDVYRLGPEDRFVQLTIRYT